MKTKQCKYVNRNAFPLFLKDREGNMKFFQPGHWEYDLWWSGSVGPKKLSKEPLTVGEQNSRRNGAHLKGEGSFKQVELIPWQKKRGRVVQDRFRVRQGRGRGRSREESACAMSCMVACEMETQAVSGSDHWVLVGETYFCKYCDWNTRDEATVKEHFRVYHEEAVSGTNPSDN